MNSMRFLENFSSLRFVLAAMDMNEKGKGLVHWQEGTHMYSTWPIEPSSAMNLCLSRLI